MRPERILAATFLGVTLSGSPSPAQTQFTCGSTGSNGALVVDAGQTATLDVPDNGVFNFTTISVSGTLNFNRNTRFNPPVILLATGNVVIETGGSVDVSGANGSAFTGGAGGPGGLDGGAPGIAGGAPGAGHGPGAGAGGVADAPGGNAAYAGDPFTNDPGDGTTYGSPLLVPLAGGSGGGGDDNIGGGGGGGAVLLCSPTQVTVDGSVVAAGGGQFATGSGSGGGIRIVSPVVRGTGLIWTHGGAGGFGGHGRVRIDLIDRSALAMNFQPPAALSVGSFMAVFPSTVPRLDIVRVAGNDIPIGTASPLAFMLPFNSPATQSITVRATGFTGIVPVSVVITPDSGDRVVVDAQINADVEPAEISVNVDFPQNVTVRVHAWTR
jgi:hypothetical protein